MSNTMAQARRALALLDLTSLNDDDTEADIETLTNRAVTPHGNVAAVCVWPKFVVQANNALSSTPVEVAAVANFPSGASEIEGPVEETRSILFNGGDEVDVVLPYHALKAGNEDLCREFVTACKAACGVSGKLKVILETGELGNPDLIAKASMLSLEAGADFIKTSTGKVPVNATLEAAEIMLTAIKDFGAGGFKAAGGIRDLETASDYLALADRIMGPDWAQPETFRLGASGLLTDLLSRLNGVPSEKPAEGY